MVGIGVMECWSSCEVARRSDDVGFVVPVTNGYKY